MSKTFLTVALLFISCCSPRIEKDFTKEATDLQKQCELEEFSYPKAKDFYEKGCGDLLEAKIEKLRQDSNYRRFRDYKKSEDLAIRSILYFREALRLEKVYKASQE